MSHFVLTRGFPSTSPNTRGDHISVPDAWPDGCVCVCVCVCVCARVCACSCLCVMYGLENANWVKVEIGKVGVGVAVKYIDNTGAKVQAAATL